MSVVLRATPDILQYFDLYPKTIFINPVSYYGTMEIGISGEIVKRYPDFREHFLQKRPSSDDCIGSLIPYQVGKLKMIISCVSKKHSVEGSTVDDIELCAQNIADYLGMWPTHDVVMPMFSTGLPTRSYAVVFGILKKYLDDHPRPIHIGASPTRLAREPRYLCIGGSRTYNNYDRFVMSVSESFLDWDEVPFEYDRYFDAVISGGAPGTDIMAARYAKERNIRCVTVPADWKTFPRIAGFLRNKVMSDIGTHFIMYPSATGCGTQHMIRTVQLYNSHHSEKKKRLIVIPV